MSVVMAVATSQTPWLTWPRGVELASCTRTGAISSSRQVGVSKFPDACGCFSKLGVPSRGCPYHKSPTIWVRIQGFCFFLRSPRCCSIGGGIPARLDMCAITTIQQMSHALQHAQ